MLLLLGGCVAAAWVLGAPLVPADAGRAGSAGERWAWVFLACLAVAFVLYLGALWLFPRAAPRLIVVAALAAAIQVVPLAAPLLLSTDAWTYWEYGAIGAGGGDPYRDVPSEAPNPAFDHAGAAWRDTTSVYGPAFTLGSELVARALGSSSNGAAWTYKAMAALAMLALTGLAARLAADRSRAAALVGWNPLFAVHFAGGGHNDALMLALVLAALALAGSGRRVGAGIGWALAVLVKWIPIVFLVLRGLEARATSRRVGHLGFAATALLVAGVATWRYGIDWLRAFGPLARNAEGQTSFALPHRFEQLGVPHPVALGLAALTLAAGLAWLAREALAGRAHLGRTGCLLLATTPWLAPWYAVWALPLAAVEGDRKAQLVALAFCAYLLPQTVPI